MLQLFVYQEDNVELKQHVIIKTANKSHSARLKAAEEGQTAFQYEIMKEKIKRTAHVPNEVLLPFISKTERHSKKVS